VLDDGDDSVTIVEGLSQCGVSDGETSEVESASLNNIITSHRFEKLQIRLPWFSRKMENNNVAIARTATISVVVSYWTVTQLVSANICLQSFAVGGGGGWTLAARNVEKRSKLNNALFTGKMRRKNLRKGARVLLRAAETRTGGCVAETQRCVGARRVSIAVRHIIWTLLTTRSVWHSLHLHMFHRTAAVLFPSVTYLQLIRPILSERSNHWRMLKSVSVFLRFTSMGMA
jgi:hypothetical protein